MCRLNRKNFSKETKDLAKILECFIFDYVIKFEFKHASH